MSADTVAVVAPRSRSDSLLVTAVRGSDVRRKPDELIVEEPMSIQLDGNLVATTMRTPGHDYELAVGFCFGDGLLAGAPVVGVRYCAKCGVNLMGSVVAPRSEVQAPVAAAAPDYPPPFDPLPAPDYPPLSDPMAVAYVPHPRVAGSRLRTPRKCRWG